MGDMGRATRSNSRQQPNSHGEVFFVALVSFTEYFYLGLLKVLPIFLVLVLLCPALPGRTSVRRLSAARVIARLSELESKETDAWFRDDYRISRLAVSYAQQGYPDPWGYAFWMVVGVHPAKFQEKYEARDRALLGSSYDAWHGVVPAAVPRATASPKGVAGSRAADKSMEYPLERKERAA